MVVILMLATLAYAQEPEYDYLAYLPLVLRPLQVTKTAQVMALIIEPDPDPEEGTFRITSVRCWQAEFLNWHGECRVEIRNDTDTLLIAEAVTITSDDPRVDEFWLVTRPPLALNARQSIYIYAWYSLHDDVEYGSVVFDIEITCVDY